MDDCLAKHKTGQLVTLADPGFVEGVPKHYSSPLTLLEGGLWILPKNILKLLQNAISRVLWGHRPQYLSSTRILIDTNQFDQSQFANWHKPQSSDTNEWFCVGDIYDLWLICTVRVDDFDDLTGSCRWFNIRAHCWCIPRPGQVETEINYDRASLGYVSVFWCVSVRRLRWDIGQVRCMLHVSVVLHFICPKSWIDEICHTDETWTHLVSPNFRTNETSQT